MRTAQMLRSMRHWRKPQTHDITKTLENKNDGVHLHITSWERFDDKIEFHLTEGLGNYSVIRIFLTDKDEARVEIERFAPDQEYDIVDHTVGLFLFGVRTLDGKNGW